MLIGNSEYKLLFLDTNALREIITNGTSFQEFSHKFLIGDIKYAPVFSIYNIFELRPYHDIYMNFIKIFSIIPCMMLFPYRLIIEEEIKAYSENRTFTFNGNLINAFSSLGIGDSYNLEIFLNKLWDDEPLRNTISREIEGLKEIAETWNTTKDNFINTKKKYPKLDLRKYFFDKEKETIIKDLENHGISLPHDINILKLPGNRVMEFSHFMRVYNRNLTITPNDVMDVKMSCCIPYVDAVITENYQAELYKQMKSFIKPISNLEINRLNIFK